MQIVISICDILAKHITQAPALHHWQDYCCAEPDLRDFPDANLRYARKLTTSYEINVTNPC